MSPQPRLSILHPLPHLTEFSVSPGRVSTSSGRLLRLGLVVGAIASLGSRIDVDHLREVGFRGLEDQVSCSLFFESLEFEEAQKKRAHHLPRLLPPFSLSVQSWSLLLSLLGIALLLLYLLTFKSLLSGKHLHFPLQVFPLESSSFFHPSFASRIHHPPSLPRPPPHDPTRSTSPSLNHDSNYDPNRRDDRRVHQRRVEEVGRRWVSLRAEEGEGGERRRVRGELPSFLFISCFPCNLERADSLYCMLFRYPGNDA